VDDNPTGLLVTDLGSVPSYELQSKNVKHEQEKAIGFRFHPCIH